MPNKKQRVRLLKEEIKGRQFKQSLQNLDSDELERFEHLNELSDDEYTSAELEEFEALELKRAGLEPEAA